jgi:hypothetical protein
MVWKPFGNGLQIELPGNPNCQDRRSRCPAGQTLKMQAVFQEKAAPAGSKSGSRQAKCREALFFLKGINGEQGQNLRFSKGIETGEQESA